MRPTPCWTFICVRESWRWYPQHAGNFHCQMAMLQQPNNNGKMPTNNHRVESLHPLWSTTPSINESTSLASLYDDKEPRKNHRWPLPWWCYCAEAAEVAVTDAHINEESQWRGDTEIAGEAFTEGIYELVLPLSHIWNQLHLNCGFLHSAGTTNPGDPQHNLPPSLWFKLQFKACAVPRGYESLWFIMACWWSNWIIVTMHLKAANSALTCHTSQLVLDYLSMPLNLL